MSTAVTIPLSQYLSTTYRPDCEYIDGELLERNVGELDHSRLQTLISGYLLRHERALGISVLVEQRLQVTETRYRVPDICVLSGPLPTTQILKQPPHLCIEILSPSDSVDSMQDRIDDYLRFGVTCVWLINPRNLRAFYYNSEGMREAKDGMLRTTNPDIALPIRELEKL